MFSSSLDTLLKVSKTTYFQKLFAYDCVTLYLEMLEVPVFSFKSCLQALCCFSNCFLDYQEY